MLKSKTKYQNFKNTLEHSLLSVCNRQRLFPRVTNSALIQLTRAGGSAMSKSSGYCAMRRDCKGSFNPKAYLGPPAPTFKDTVTFAAARSLHNSLLATRCPLSV